MKTSIKNETLLSSLAYFFIIRLIIKVFIKYYYSKKHAEKKI